MPSRINSNFKLPTSSSSPNLPYPPHVHFVGIGGIGMSSLAYWFLGRKWLVSGSDREESLITRDLLKRGAKVKIGHKSAYVDRRTDLLIHNQAIGRDNPELRRAKQLKIETLSYPQMIGKITRLYTTVAIAGAHGKSTTTAITALVMNKAKLDPSVIIGTRLKEFNNTNSRVGKSDYLVLESDEYGRAFLNYEPTYGVITNIDKEHLDIYRDLRDIKNTFLKYIAGFRSDGGLVLNKDDKNLFSLKSKIDKIAKKNDLRVVWYSLKDPITAKIKKIIRVPGKHNLSNARGAHLLATKFLNVSEKDSLSAIKSFHGTWRRMELAGEYGGALVFDDYAHHPTEIKATLSAFKEKYPKKKIVCVFQPHLSDRLTKLFGDFVTAFNDADEALILPIYKVAGRENDMKHKTSQDLARAIQKKQPHKPLFYMEHPKDLHLALASFSPLNKRVIVMMGAGDIASLTQKLIKMTPPSQIRKGC